MAASEHVQPRAVFGAGNLITPELPLLHSFSKETKVSQLAPIQTVSPPVSPETKILPSFQYPRHDAPLYPEESFSDAGSSHSPLFSDNSSPELLPSRPATSQSSFEDRVTRQGISDLGGFLGPRFHLEPTRSAVRSYYGARMAELEDIRRARLPTPTKSASAAPRDLISAKQLASMSKFDPSKPTGITKTKPAPKVPTKAAIAKPVAPKPKATRNASPAKVAAPPKSASRATTEEFHDRAFPQAQTQPKHKRAAPTKKVEGKEDDSTWRELPDYCPPVSTLDSVSKPLKVQWKGNALDISDESELDELHPAEREAASDLRLRPQQYLANKRRIFMARVKHLREGKNFTKTAAQNATNIDVNKTSKLWEAFDRVGWFDEKYFLQYKQE